MDHDAWPTEYHEVLRRYLPSLPESTELKGDESLSSLGLDSLGAIQLLIEIEDALDVQIPDELLDESTFASPSSLWAAVAASKKADRSG